MSKLVGVTARAAILAAAGHIELNPRLYRDADTLIPDSLNARASAMGWIAYFAGYQRPDRCASGVALALADAPQAFHWQMCAIDTGWRSWFVSWRSNAGRAAWCLRQYADRHHPADGDDYQDPQQQPGVSPCR